VSDPISWLLLLQAKKKDLTTKNVADDISKELVRLLSVRNICQDMWNLRNLHSFKIPSTAIFEGRGFG
jgi:hypothetical protein